VRGAPLRVALVGLGHIGRVHSEAVRRTPGLELVAGHDLDAGLAAVLPDDVPFDRTLTATLARDPDVVVVATPNVTHAEVARQALSHVGLVLLEKPAAVTREALDGLLRTQGAAERLRFALHARYGREVTAALELVADRGLSTPTQFESHFEDPYLAADGSIRQELVGLGDAWLDSGVNALSVLARFIALDRLEMHDAAAGGRSADGRTVDAIVRLTTHPAPQEPNLIQGSITTRWGDQARKWTHFSWPDGTDMLLDHQREQLRVSTPDGEERLRELATPDGRLMNHYLGLFGELVAEPNRAMTSEALGIDDIHRLFFDVVDSVSTMLNAEPFG
jgi:predicted dehydrogenase